MRRTGQGFVSGRPKGIAGLFEGALTVFQTAFQGCACGRMVGGGGRWWWRCSRSGFARDADGEEFPGSLRSAGVTVVGELRLGRFQPSERLRPSRIGGESDRTAEPSRRTVRAFTAREARAVHAGLQHLTTAVRGAGKTTAARWRPARCPALHHLIIAAATHCHGTPSWTELASRSKRSSLGHASELAPVVPRRVLLHKRIAFGTTSSRSSPRQRTGST